MRPIRITQTLTAAVTNSIALLQTTGAAANLTLNGALSTGGVATLASPGKVTITATSVDQSGVNFTITGTDYRGQTISEVLVGPNNATVTSVNTYATVTKIAASAAVLTTGVSVGNAASASSTVVPLDVYANPFQVSLSLEITGTANATAQYTPDSPYVATSLDALTWFNHSELTNQTSSNMASLISACAAVRVVTNSGTGTVTLVVQQSGGTGAA